MIDTNLILIDGIAGTGKTTISRKLFEIIQGLHGNAVIYHEFTEPHPIHKWEVDDYLTWERKTIENWESLANELARNDSVGILESSLLQGTIGLLHERDIDEDTICEHARRVPSFLRDASPVLIYLVLDDIPSHIERTYAQRSERWRTKIDGFVQETAFGLARGLSGLDGYVVFLSALRRVSDRLFNMYEMPKLTVNVSSYAWADIENQIFSFLGIPSR